MSICGGLFLLATTLAGAGQTPPAVDQIMARVAENQDRAENLRTAFVYNQRLLIRLKRGNGKVARQETREYVAVPTEKGTHKELVRFTGEYEKDGRMIPYSEVGFTYKDVDIDGDLIDSLADDLANDKRSKDGISGDLFPLTSKEQKKYLFTLKGTEEYRGKKVHRIVFEPRHATFDDDEGSIWAGEILVDTVDLQPVFVSTHMAKGLPAAVRTLLGTNLRGLGFQVAYEKFDEGLWFPVTYGSEFEVKALFFYKRRIGISLANSGFQRSQVAARVTFDMPLQVEKVLRLMEVSLPWCTVPY
jgi:hypothetical protein